MKFLRLIHLTVILALLAACAPSGETPSATSAPTSSLPTPVVNVTSMPDIRATFEAFVTAWRADDYAAMYAMLSAASQQAISQDDFVARYKDAMNTMSLRQLDYSILATNTTPKSADVTFRVVYRTYIAGDIEREMTARWLNEGGQWKLDWSETLILPELAGGKKLVMDYQIPLRGNIYDKDGNPIVAEDEVYAIGLQPGNIVPEQEETLLREMARIAGSTPEDIAASYRFAQPNWYIPVGEASIGEIQNRLGLISGLGGVLLTQYRSRYYYAGGLAPHIVGYVISVPAEEFDSYKRRGYSGAEKVGYSGIEKWGEEILGGKRGGRLYVLNPDGTIGAALGQSGQVPGSSIYLTLQSDFQRQVQDALKGLTGAVVVIERDTGRVLAMAASPSFDPNLFEGQNPNRQILGQVLSNPANPLLNRATQSTYPLGSVFKIITMAAALESGDFTAESTYDCQYEFTELGSPILYDWTWERYQRELAATGEGKTKPSGLLTLPEGLMRSCNPW
ncbi:MAG: penicillin-binding transpeptidase domain-containing protein, partial [Anaerolineales bacterium]